MREIPFNRPYMTGKELGYIAEAHRNLCLAGDGDFTRRCQQWLEKNLHCRKALLTHSGTAALEMAAILADIRPGDEVIMPSYTFVSTANAFVLRGGIPVFVDIRPDTMNIDESRIEAAITGKTKAIVAVHYGGISCAMDPILEIARRHRLFVIEDAAQGVSCSYKGKPLGSLGHLAALSFHETKNIISGEGGALLINEERFIERAEILREKGTNRTKFFRGQVDKYTWVDLGSSFLPGEITAAFLWAQMQEVEPIKKRRLEIWDGYHRGFLPLEKEGIRRPVVPEECQHGGHMYYLLLKSLAQRTYFIEELFRRGMHSVFHYVPLHSSPAGRKFGRAHGDLPVTDDLSSRLVRLPFWIGMKKEVRKVVQHATEILEKHP
ncbi:MAG TPA: dTDP-4-amino-4,6-dideoxygalactose transaminase [Candidatus Omnitrophota bacterium]|nr:dTDP-4-amino-4,6-dideoxygalactose transaminase [Candidatus Omnitrophota bacterium]HPS36565.1 dTDP-4-amino-4,6-dideoxygalactose transaminase [Candidatus Omnitrophota bacterium]